MASLKYAQRFFRGAQSLGASERAALARELRTMEAAALPEPDDVPTVMPPSLRVWRRRLGASDRYLYFVLTDDGGALLVGVGGFI